jgi:hypothetical protein
VATHAVTIAHRYNGPPHSGQGGYSAGMVAAFLEQPAQISLRRPVPLDTPLRIEGDGDVRLLDGDEVIADGHAVAGVDVDVPDPVSVADAREATTRYLGTREGPFSHCFVCGLARHDNLGVHAGEVPGRGIMATPWTPPPWTAGDTGAVRPEFVWAVLDCPATFASLLAGASTGFLARLAVRIDGAVSVGEEHVIVSWPIEVDGRKFHSGAALFTADGALLAAARALLIAPRDGAS